MVLEYYVYEDLDHRKSKRSISMEEMPTYLDNCTALFILSPNSNIEIKIEFDVDSGKVLAINKEENITTFFSFDSLIEPVKDAIRVLAKRKLLEELKKLDKELARVIGKRHYDNEKFINGDEKSLNSTLIILKGAFDPKIFSRQSSTAEKMIANILRELKIEDIKCGSDVIVIIDRIKDTQTQNNNDLSSRAEI